MNIYKSFAKTWATRYIYPYVTIALDTYMKHCILNKEHATDHRSMFWTSSIIILHFNMHRPMGILVMTELLSQKTHILPKYKMYQHSRDYDNRIISIGSKTHYNAVHTHLDFRSHENSWNTIAQLPILDLRFYMWGNLQNKRPVHIPKIHRINQSGVILNG